MISSASNELMPDPIGSIFQWRCPAEMLRSNAPEMTVAARVRRLIPRCGWRAIEYLADNSADLGASAIIDNGRISFDALERPDQAFITFIGKRDLFKKTSGLAFGRLGQKYLRIAVLPVADIVNPAQTPCMAWFGAVWHRAWTIGRYVCRDLRERIAMLVPALIVDVAQSAAFGGSLAFWNRAAWALFLDRAYSWVSHLRLRARRWWSERVVGREPSARSLFYVPTPEMPAFTGLGPPP